MTKSKNLATPEVPQTIKSQSSLLCESIKQKWLNVASLIAVVNPPINMSPVRRCDISAVNSKK